MAFPCRLADKTAYSLYINKWSSQNKNKLTFCRKKFGKTEESPKTREITGLIEFTLRTEILIWKWACMYLSQNHSAQWPIKPAAVVKKTCETTALHLIQMQCIFLQLLLPAFYISCTLECPLHARIKGGGKIALLFHHCTVVGFVKKMAENQHKAYWYSSWWFLC